MVVHLYDLDRTELRRLALEALLISDGPDRMKQRDGTEAPVSDAVEVRMKEMRGGSVLFVIDGI